MNLGFLKFESEKHGRSTVNFQMKSALLIIQIIDSKIINASKRNSDSKRITDYFVIMMLPLNSTHFRPNCGRHGFNTYFSKSNLQKQQMVAIALASPETAWQHRNSVAHTNCCSPGPGQGPGPGRAANHGHVHMVGHWQPPPRAGTQGIT